MKKSYKILLISSSTGGHAIPIKELFEGLNQDRRFNVRVVHSGSAIEKELFSKDSFVIKSGKLNRYQIFKNLPEAFKIFWAMLAGLWLLIRFRPNLIFSKGSFNSFPVLFWAKVVGIPYFLHETDSEMGMANRMFYKNSVKTFVSFPPEIYGVKSDKLEYSGMIVREFKSDQSKRFNQPVIFIIGGSQGSEAINKVVAECLPRLLENYYVIHSVGKQNFEETKKLAASLDNKIRDKYIYFDFSLSKTEEYMPQATLVISRAGGTIGEIAKLRKASILVPYPFAAADHQMKNAKFLEKIGGAIIIKQEMLNCESLLERVRFITSDQKNWQIIGENAFKAIRSDGKEQIILSLKKYLGLE